MAAGSGLRYGKPKALVDSGRGPWVRTSLAVLKDCDVRIVVIGAAAGEVEALLPEGVHAVYNPDHASGMGSSLREGLARLCTPEVLHGDGHSRGPHGDMGTVTIQPGEGAAGPAERGVAAAGPDEPGEGAAAPGEPGDGAAGPDEPGHGGPAGPEDLPTGLCDFAVVHLVDLPGVGSEVVRRLIGVARSASAPGEVLLRASYRGVPGHPVVLGRTHWAGVMEMASGDAGARAYFRLHPPADVECGDIGTGGDVDLPPAS